MAAKKIQGEISDTIQTLRDQTISNPEYRAIFQALSKRDRARGDMSVVALKRLCGENKISMSMENCMTFLSFLAASGIGKAEYNKVGGIVNLINIQFTLQSVGQSALGNADKLEPYAHREFTRSKQTAYSAKANKITGQIKMPAPQSKSNLYTLDGMVNGKKVSLSFEADQLTYGEVMALRSKLGI